MYRVKQSFTSCMIAFWVVGSLVGDHCAFAQAKPPSKVKEAKKTSEQAPKNAANAPKMQRPPDRGVMAMFANAQKLYKQGKYDQALAAYGIILQRYPAHEPTIIQFAKTLYRLDRIQEAFSIFTRVNPLHLDEETSYEYGFSFYIGQQYEGCLYAFKRVPQGHALYDLANYYGALCAMKTRRYQESEDMLEKAVVLPDKLAKSRTLYLKHVQALRLMQERNEMLKDRKKEQDMLAAQKVQAKPGDKKQDPKKLPEKPPEKKADEPYVHPGFCVTDGLQTEPCRKNQSASAGYEVQEQTTYYSGSKEEKASNKISSFSFSTGVFSPIPVKAKKNSGAVGLQIDLMASDTASEGETIRIISEENDKDLVKALSEKAEKSHSIAGEMWAKPWIEFPFPQEVWTAFYGEMYFNYPEFKRADRTGSWMGGMQIARKWPTFTLKTRTSFTQVLDSKTKPKTSKMSGWAYVKVPLPNDLSFTLTSEYKKFTYIVETLDGPSYATNVKGLLLQILPLGFDVGVKGTYEFQGDNLKHNIGSYEYLTADGQSLTGLLFMDLCPAAMPWICLSAYYSATKTTWKTDQEDTQEAYEQNVPGYMAELDFSVSLDLKF